MPRSQEPLFFADRRDAGERLADELRLQRIEAEIVLAVPRGGVVVGAPVAERLALPLDVLVARKVGVPAQPELAMGAVTRFGVVWNEALVASLRLPKNTLSKARHDARAELDEREAVYRAVRPAEPVQGRHVMIVDDGLATGATVAAAVQAVQAAEAGSVTVAVPVASAEAVERIEALHARVVALSIPERFGAVGAFYERFEPVTDEECVALLRAALPDG